MTNQTKTVETLQTDVDQVAADLAEAKKLTDEALQKSSAETALLKAEMLMTQIKTAKEEANTKLEALKGKTDATSKAEVTKLEAEIKKYEAMLTVLDTSKTELTTLKAGVTTPVVQDKDEKNDEKPEEKKNRFKKQREGLSDSTEEHHALKNTARIVGGIGVVYLAYRGIKALFGRGKKKEEKKEGDETEDKSFLHKAWDVIKWPLGIGSGYYLIHGLVTGRWDLKNFFNRDKKEKINPDDLNDRYEEKVPEALKPKYDKFAGMVDDYRKANGSTDTLGTLESEEGKKVEIKRGAIPASMDNAYDNVGDILDTNDDILDEWGRVGGKLWDLVTSVGGKVVGGLLRGGVGIINGLTSAMFDSNGEPNDKFKDRAEKEDLTRDEQVANLLQKYSMVRTYLNDKRKQLKRKYIIEQLELEGVKDPTEEQIEAYDLNMDMVELRLQRDFLDKKIVSEDDADSAVTALENKGIYDTTVSVETTAVLDEVKEIKKEIVPDETIRERAKDSADINTDDTLRTELSGVSTKFAAHLKEGVLHRNILEGIANAWGILNLDELWNSEADDLEEAIEKLGFGDEVNRFALENNDFYSKLQNKTLTKADIEKFEKTINDYFSLLQKVMLEAQTQQENEGRWERKTWFMGRLYTLVNSGGTYVIIGGALLNAGAKNLFKMKKSPVKYVLDFTSPKLKLLFREPMRRVNIPTVLGNKYLKRAMYGASNAQCDKFIKDFKSGKMTYDEAKDVFSHHAAKYPDRKAKAGIADGTFNGLLTKEMNLSVEQIQIMEKYFNDKNIRKILKDGTTTVPDLLKKLKAYDGAIDLVTDVDKSNAIRRLFEQSKFTKLSDMDNIIKNMDKIDGTALSNLSNKELKLLGKDISTLATADDINAYIKTLKDAANVVSASKDIFDLIDTATAKDIIAKKLASSRTVDGYPGEFSNGGKLENDANYASFKKEYEDVLTNNPGKTKTKIDLRKTKYAEIDNRLAEKLMTDKHALATEILEANRTAELTTFAKKIDDEVAILDAKKALFTGTDASDKLAVKTIEQQVADLKEINTLTKTMSTSELDAFEALYKTLGAKPGVASKIADTWKLAEKDEKLMKALSEGDVDQLTKLKKSGTVIADEVIEVFGDIKIKKVAKILEATDSEALIKRILKAFARAT